MKENRCNKILNELLAPKVKICRTNMTLFSVTLLLLMMMMLRMSLSQGYSSWAMSVKNDPNSTEESHNSNFIIKERISDGNQSMHYALISSTNSSRTNGHQKRNLTGTTLEEPYINKTHEGEGDEVMNNGSNKHDASSVNDVNSFPNIISSETTSTIPRTDNADDEKINRSSDVTSSGSDVTSETTSKRNIPVTDNEDEEEINRSSDVTRSGSDVTSETTSKRNIPQTDNEDDEEKNRSSDVTSSGSDVTSEMNVYNDSGMGNKVTISQHAVTSLEPNITTPVPDGTKDEDEPPLPAATLDVIADDVDFEFVTLVDHRYQGVVVHIGDGVPYGESLLENIKRLFNMSQDALEFATRPTKANEGGLTFGHVIITVPSNWEKDFPAPPVSLGPPSVRVEPPSSSHGHVPYTLQPGGCGERGLYIHLTPEFVNDMFNKIVEDRIGKAESVLVHEWAHLRWGVFDEYVTPDVLAHPHLSLARPFYLDDKGHVKPSVCPLDIQGWIVEEVNEKGPETSSPASNGTSKVTSSNITSFNMSSGATTPEQGILSRGNKRKIHAKEATTTLRLCKSFTPNGLPAPHCFFYSNSKQKTKGSLMGYFSNNQLFSPSKRFCGDGDGVVPHDPAAPTPQNLRCGGRSVWEVMREHDDFASHCDHHCGKSQTPPMNAPTLTPLQEPKFIFYKRQNPKALLLVLDCSQLPNNMLSSIKQDLIRFLDIFVPMDTKVLALTSQSLVQGTEDFIIDRQSADLQLTALTCNPSGTDEVALAAADWLTRQSYSHSLVLTLQSNPDRGLQNHLSPRLPPNSALHAVTIEQACPDELLKTSERRFSCTKHRTGDDLTETLRGVLALHSAEEGLTQVYAQSHPLQHAYAGRPGTKTSVSGHFFMNFCRGSSLLSVFAPTRVLGRNYSSVDMTLVHDGTETPLSLYKQKLYNGSERVNIVIKIPCDSAHGDWEYVIRTPTPSFPTVEVGPPETALTVDVKVYQDEDEDTAVRINTFILAKKRLSRNCSSVDQPRNSSGSSNGSSIGNSNGCSNGSSNNSINGSSNGGSNGICSDSSNDSNNATERDPYRGTKMTMPEELPTPMVLITAPSTIHNGGGAKNFHVAKHLRAGKKKDRDEQIGRFYNSKTAIPSAKEKRRVNSRNSVTVQSQKSSQIGYSDGYLQHKPKRDEHQSSIQASHKTSEFSETKHSIKRASRNVHAEESDVADPPKESGEQPKVHRGRIISYNDSIVRIVSVLTQGGKGERTPVLGASVMAFVSREGSPDSLQVPLLDSGIAADEIEDDGIYSGFLTGISGNGRYSVSVEATDGKSSHRRINTIRQNIFWDQHRQEKDSLSPSRMDLYRMKVRCSGVHTALTILIQQQSESSDETAVPLTNLNLEKEDREGSSSGRMYSGEVEITHSGKLIVPRGCILITIIGQGGEALDRLASSSHRGSPGGSFSPVLPVGKNSKQTFDSPATTTFIRHLPALKEGQEEGSGDNDGGEERISKESDVKEKEVLELTAETSKFRVKRAVEQLEVVEYTSRDILPPGRVRDLTVTKVHYMRPAVTLEWSSPGDDLYSGTAHRIDLRYHHIREGLRVEFQRANPVLEEKHVPPGALEPLPAGEKQSVIIILKELSMEDLEEDYTLHFGLIVWDEANNAGSLSNLAEARFTVAEKQKELKDLASSRQLLSIAFSVLVAVLGVVIVLVCFAKIKHYLQKRKKADCYDYSYTDVTTPTKFGTNPRSRSRESSTKAGGASHGSSSGNAKRRSKSGQSKPSKPDGVLQNIRMSEYCVREPKGKQINYYGTT